VLALAACGGSSNGGTSAAGTTGTSAAASTARVAGTGSQAQTTSSAAGSGKASAAAAPSSYSLTGGCLLVGSTRTCDLPRRLVLDYRQPAVEKAIDEFVRCLDKRGTSGASLTGCRYELASDVVLRRFRRRPRS
jgi:hypothetical protein